MSREIIQIIEGLETSDGAGVKLRRIIGGPDLNMLDPFLLFDEFGSDDPNDYLNVSFSIEEKESSLKVAYTGVTPDMFADGREVVVEGTLGKDGVFHANTLLTSCPSKYEAEKEAGKMHPGTLNGDKYNGSGLKKADSLPKTTI